MDTVTEFSIRRVLCSVELNGHSRHTVSLAAEMAAAVDATLTLVHITAGVGVYGPGGTHLDTAWKEQIVGYNVIDVADLDEAVYVASRHPVAAQGGRIEIRPILPG